MTASAEQSPITVLLGLFSSLSIEGIDGHDYIDYLFVKYKLKKLSDLSPEMTEEQKGILENMRDKEGVRLRFRKYLLEIRAKLGKYGWDAFDK